MPAVFEKDYYLRTSDFDCKGRLKPSCLLELFQNVAGEHAVLLGCGYNDLAPRRLMWVILRTKYRIYADCSLHDTVHLRTWPCPPSRVGFRREYLVTDLKGSIVAKGSSEWALVDAESRSLAIGQRAYPEGLDFCTEQSLPGRLERLRPFEGEELLVLEPGYSRIDVNGHVNNTAYADFALDAAAPLLQGGIESFQIDYRHELRQGCTLHLSGRREEDGMLICGRDEGGELSFLCRMVDGK